MTLRFYFATPYFAAEEARTHAFNLPYILDAEEGIADAWTRLDAQGEYESDGYVAINAEDERLAPVGIKTLPAFLVYDVDRQRVIFKLEGRAITRENVQRIALTAWSLTPDPQNELNYLTESGKSVSTDALLNTKPCPDWVPGFLCNEFGTRSWAGFGLTDVLVWTLVLILLLFLYKALR